MLLNGVGNRLHELRQRKNISLEKLSKEVSIAKSNLSRYENNEYIPSLENTYKLAKYYGVTIDYIAGVK